MSIITATALPQWTLMLPAGTPLATGGHDDLHVRCDRIRQATVWLARQQGIPPLSDPHLMCVVHLPAGRRADPAGWTLTARAAMEGLAQAGVIGAPADPELRGLRADCGRIRFSIRVYAGGRPPSALTAVTRSHLENYLDPVIRRMSARQAATRLGVTPRTVHRWRALIRETGDDLWTFTVKSPRRPGRVA